MSMYDKKIKVTDQKCHFWFLTTALVLGVDGQYSPWVAAGHVVNRYFTQTHTHTKKWVFAKKPLLEPWVCPKW